MNFREWYKTVGYKFHPAFTRRDCMLAAFEAGQRNPLAAPALPDDIARVVKAAVVVHDAPVRDEKQVTELDAAIDALAPASLAAVEAALKAVPE